MAQFLSELQKISHKIRLPESTEDTVTPNEAIADNKTQGVEHISTPRIEISELPAEMDPDIPGNSSTVAENLSENRDRPKNIANTENTDLTDSENKSDRQEADLPLANELNIESENTPENPPLTEQKSDVKAVNSEERELPHNHVPIIWLLLREIDFIAGTLFLRESFKKTSTRSAVLNFVLMTKTGKPRYRTVSFWVLTLGAIALSGGAGTAGYGLWYLYSTLPDVSKVFSFVRDGTITIKASDGTILQQLGPATREKLDIEDIPELQIHAFIASEDRRFYQHHGIDYQGIFRAMLSNVKAGNVVQGGSTITQQLARVVFLTQERTIWRKIREALLSWKIEKHIDKKDILTTYLNNVYLGSGAYGVADAAWVYFSKSLEELTLSEMATIAGLPPAPSVYSPLVNPEVSKERRNLVLDTMVDVGFITSAEAAEAKAESLAIEPSSPKRLYVEAPYFTSFVQKELPKYISGEEIELGGLTVETTVNPKWQQIAEQIVREAVEIDGYAEGFDQAAFVAINPVTGEIKAMVGGRDFTESEFNRVTQAQRQPGSTFKGFVYTGAIAAGFAPTDGYEDANFTVDGYKPRNYNGKYRGWMSMRDALTYSTNVIAVKVLMDVGFEPTIELSQAMGIKSKLESTYSLALGGWEVNLLELTSAYGTLAAEGKQVPPHGIVRVFDRRGETIYEPKFKPQQAVDSDTAAIVTWMLESVVNYGTGTSAQLLDRPVAGKTGTSDESRDLWFIGYIPQLVAGVWLGNDDNYPTWGNSRTAAFTWRQFMEKVVEDIPVEEFPELPEFYGREPTLKTDPVQPHYVIYGDTTPDDAQKEKKLSTNGYEY